MDIIKMINDELRCKIENAQRFKCFMSSLTSVGALAIWMALLNNIEKTEKYGIIIVSIGATLFTALALATIFCNLGKETFEVKNDPTKS